ncbi:alpha/beta hydrolase [Endozoicomonas sp. SM1973]|uniref:Alpha/beta hydrolase n=1 Tax=Spartinivicinus marinus TaxID=2994442 RepID=A0A853IAX3_9GAMM|nr:alpha/beta hydrolase [Spartinivicinus marinus]MCX4028527.1 alpha/beta hydrolase [Spartinivicinus marinus]NYZ67194.1 alpha/beta hydrolase [Spartinivicinus marinus]
MPFITANQQRLYYEMQGSGEPVLLLHGLGSSSQDWPHQVSALQSDFQVITLDLRGHGQSSKPPGPYSIKMLADDVRCFAKQLGLHQYHLIGISMGGMIAFQLAVDQPPQVLSLSIINSGPHLIARSWKIRCLIYQRLLITQLLGMRITGKFIMQKLFPKPEQHALRQQGVEKWAANDKAAYVNAFKAIINWSVAVPLNNIKCPCLILTGDRDYTPISYKADYCQQLANAKLVVIEDSGHASPLDQPAQVNQALLDFLDQYDATRNYKSTAKNACT